MASFTGGGDRLSGGDYFPTLCHHLSGYASRKGQGISAWVVTLKTVCLVPREPDVFGVDRAIEVGGHCPVRAHMDAVDEVVPMQAFRRHLVFGVAGFVIQIHVMALDA